MKRLHIKVIGDVQGVFYRFSAKQEADKLSVLGWVVNDSDGSVSGIIEGERTALDKFVAWCKEGSPMAEVDDVEVSEEEYKGEFNQFEVR